MPLVEFKFIEGRTARNVETEDGHIFIKNGRHKENVYYRCVRRYNGCKSKLTLNTSSNQITNYDDDHNHQIDEVDTAVREARLELLLKTQALSTRRGTKRVIAEVVGLGDDVLLQLATSAMSQCIRRKRAKVENHPCNPTSLNFDIPPQSTTLANGENCLLYDHGPGAGRFLIFSTQRSLEMLAQSSSWFIDATFKVVHGIFFQLLSIHARMGSGWSFPAAFVLMPNKSRSTYETVFDELNRLKPGLMPDNVMVDFELALIRAIEVKFPLSYVHGCFFHYCQAIFRKVSQEGLATQYSDRTSDIRQGVRRMMTLPFLPEHDIEEAWEEVKGSLSAALESVSEYFEETWQVRAGDFQ